MILSNNTINCKTHVNPISSTLMLLLNHQSMEISSQLLATGKKTRILRSCVKWRKLQHTSISENLTKELGTESKALLHQQTQSIKIALDQDIQIKNLLLPLFIDLGKAIILKALLSLLDIYLLI